MMKTIIALLIVSLFCSSCSYVFAKEPCTEEKQMLERKRIDLDTKSIKGWIRLLNNRNKQCEYGTSLTKDERNALIKCLTDELEYRKKTCKLS